MKIFQFRISVPNKKMNHIRGLSNPIPEEIIVGVNRCDQDFLWITSRLTIMICYFKDGRNWDFEIGVFNNYRPISVLSSVIQH